MTAMIETLRGERGQRELMGKARELLRTDFYPSIALITPTPADLKVCQCLAAEGALVADADRVVFSIPSPLIRSVLLCHVDGVDRRRTPSAPVPYRRADGLDLPV